MPYGLACWELLVGLGAGRGEDDFVRAGPDEGGHLGAGFGQRLAVVGVRVVAGGVAEPAGQVRRGCRDAGVDRRGGVAVEVDGPVGQGRVGRWRLLVTPGLRRSPASRPDATPACRR
jgi:hypothetical protein